MRTLHDENKWKNAEKITDPKGELMKAVMCDMDINKFCRLKRDYRHKEDKIKAYELCIIRKISSKKVDVERVRRKDKKIVLINDIPIEDVIFLENNITEDEFLDTMLKCALRYLFEHDPKNEWLKKLLCEYVKGKRTCGFDRWRIE